MSVNEEQIAPGSDSFWEVDQYKKTVKRTEDGLRLCNEFLQFLHERAEIEKHYSKSLKEWSKKWAKQIDNGPEYGTTVDAFKGVLREAEQVADVHTGVKEELTAAISQKIKEWRGETYHKNVVGPCKETKLTEEEFRKAQKPWAKKLGKMVKAKKEYHNACKLERSAINQESNSRGDSSVSSDQMKKFQDKVEKCKKDVEATKKRYTTALEELNGSNAKYMEEMMEAFEHSQDFERRRLDFFKSTLFDVHACLNISAKPQFPQIYDTLDSTLSLADSDKDLKWWSFNRGADMPMQWPEFEEYKQELREITKKKGGEIADGGIVTDSGVTLRGIKYNEDSAEYSQDFHSISRKDKKGVVGSVGDGVTLTAIQKSDTPPVQAQPRHSAHNSTSSEPSASQPLARKVSYDPELNPFGEEEDLPMIDSPEPPTSSIPSGEKKYCPQFSAAKVPKRHVSPNCRAYDASMNPFGDEEDSVREKRSPHPPRPPPVRPPRHRVLGERKPRTNNGGNNPFDDEEDLIGYDHPLEDDGSEGVPVRALYDYDGQEGDELTFKQGEIFIKIKDRDDQGWCTGRKDGRVGLYPDNYVEMVTN